MVAAIAIDCGAGVAGAGGAIGAASVALLVHVLLALMVCCLWL